MKQTILLAAGLACALALPATAQDANSNVEPGKAPLTTQVAPDRSSGAGSAAPRSVPITLTETEAKTWFDKPV